MFNIEKLVKFAVAEIEKFAVAHQNETFYGFAIDADLLCLNSVEQFEKSLSQYRTNWEHQSRYLDLQSLSAAELRSYKEQVDENLEYAAEGESEGWPCTLEEVIAEENAFRQVRRQRGNPYFDPAEIEDLRQNTGDWKYQGFAQMMNTHGFDEKAYDRHYGMSDARQKTSAYGKAMDQLLEKIAESGVLDQLKRTEDFQIRRVEHTY